jgi:hypothetical protein
MFSDLETFALIWMAQSIDEERRRAHAVAVVRELGLDPRLEPLVPLPPKKRKLRAKYHDAMEILKAVSELPEPTRTELIEEIHVAAGRTGPKGS